eukprot:79935-Alexandrium_andersonii.AAC.1
MADCRLWRIAPSTGFARIADCILGTSPCKDASNCTGSARGPKSIDLQCVLQESNITRSTHTHRAVGVWAR